jgi:hypothetical protein
MTRRQTKDCYCGRPTIAHRYDVRLGALMESLDGACDGYEPEDKETELELGRAE